MSELHANLPAIASAPESNGQYLRFTWDRQFWLAILLTTAVLVPRSWLILRAHNECFDAEYHLRHGLAFMTGNPGQIVMNSNDPPLGQMLLALPMLATHCMPGDPIDPAHWPKQILIPGQTAPGERTLSERRQRYGRLTRIDVLYGNWLSPQTLLLIVGLWKTILFIPAAVLLFRWCQMIYGAHAGWLSLALLLVDPNFAGHIPVLALDTLGAEAILFSCFFMWRYFERPANMRMTWAAVSVAAAMLIKHTAVILPAVFVLYAIHYWVWVPSVRHSPKVSREVRVARRHQIALGVLCWALAVWVLLLFDYSRPIDRVAQLAADLPGAGTRWQPWLISLLSHKWPAGTYIGCFVSGFLVNQIGQISMIFGKIQPNGFWYYFPALLTFKMPIGTLLVLGLAIFAFFRIRRFSGEFGMLIPLAAFVLFLLCTRMNYGFRHFLPAYIFILMGLGRAVARVGRGLAIAAWIGVAIAAAHSFSFHPDYLSYVNWPRHRIDLQITDSNLDWNQALRQILPWLRQRHVSQPVYVMSRLGKEGVNGAWWLDDRLRFIQRGKPLPDSGLLVISPVWVCGVYDFGQNPYLILQHVEPVGWVGHAMPVFDLAQVRAARNEAGGN